MNNNNDECKHIFGLRYRGEIPCTGPIICTTCGKLWDTMEEAKKESMSVREMLDTTKEEINKGKSMDHLNGKWTQFAIDAEIDSFGSCRLVDAHNEAVAALAKAKGELASVDDRLARIPALENHKHRLDKICYAIKMAGQMAVLPLHEKAKLVGKCLHAGKKYGSKPYAYHLEGVAKSLDPGTEEEALAWLHDTIEDSTCTEATLTLLIKEFPARLVNRVLSISRKPYEEYFDYIRRVSEDEVATKVKIADLRFNLKNGEKGSFSLESRYQKAFKILLKQEDT